MFLLSSIIKRAKKRKEKRIEIEKRKENIRKQNDELYEIIMKALKRYDGYVEYRPEIIETDVFNGDRYNWTNARNKAETTMRLRLQAKFGSSPYIVHILDTPYAENFLVRILSYEQYRKRRIYYKAHKADEKCDMCDCDKDEIVVTDDMFYDNKEDL